MRIIHLVCFICLGCTGLVWAQDVQPSTTQSTPTVAPPTDSKSPSPKSAVVQQNQIKQSTTAQVKPQKMIALNDQNAFKKEQRLEELRYRHLWIAFSLVWLITLVFVYRTWQRSQAVASRLDELKTRLAQVETKE